MKRTTPFWAFTTVVPCTPPTEADTTTPTLLVATRLSAASRISTTGWVVSGTRWRAPAGCVVTTSLAAVPAVTVMGSVPLVPDTVAVMVAVPAFAASTKPVLATDATAGSDELHATVGLFTVCPLVSR